ncbi:MAG: 30S ribosomal protein S20 [Geodermatophilaceae bacterium]
MHLDLRADNILLESGDRVLFVDWPWARRGPIWVDSVLFALDPFVHGGLDPELLLAGRPVMDGAGPADVTALLLGLAGMWAEAFRVPAPPTMRDDSRPPTAIPRRRTGVGPSPLRLVLTRPGWLVNSWVVPVLVGASGNPKHFMRLADAWRTSSPRSSALRRTMQARQRNQSVKSALRTSVRRFREASASGDKDAVTRALASASRTLDKAASKGIIHKNQAANKEISDGAAGREALTSVRRQMWSAGRRSFRSAPWPAVGSPVPAHSSDLTPSP